MKKVFFLFIAIGLAMACSSNDGDGNQTGNNYDRSALLTNWADNIIVPAYEDYQAKVNTVVASAQTFTATPNESNLQALRASWLEAYKSYQYVALYNVGKAESISFKESSNTYPADISGIDGNIADGDYTLTHFSEFTRQGFPGLDYLLNGLANSDAAIVAFYATNANASGYKQYLTAVAGRLKTSIDGIVTDWNSGYRDTFVGNNDASVNGSLSKVTNNFIKSFERDIRSGKVSIPAGVLSAGVTYPQSVEAYYKNDISKELLTISLQAAQDFFNGKHFTDAATGEGLKSYLDYLNAVRDGQKLSDIINNQFTAIAGTVSPLSNSFSQQITNDNAKMLAAHAALQQNLVYLKLDMVQALDLTIDYVDGDGD